MFEKILTFNFFFFRYAFIEFTGTESVPTALQYNGVIFGGRSLK